MQEAAWPGRTCSPTDAGGRTGIVPHCGHLPAGSREQREKKVLRNSLHVWSLPRLCYLPADVETLEEPLLSPPSELSVLERLGLHR